MVTIVLIAGGAAPFAQTRTAAAEDPFARRGWHLQLTTHGALEAWNYNISHEELAGVSTGLTYGLRDGLVLTATGSLTHVWQPGSNAAAIAALVGVRGRVFRTSRVAVFLELEIGASDADTLVPPRGTRFNYLAQGGVGSTVRVGRRTHLLAGVKWIHVSNGGLAGRDRNPDIEAVGPMLGLLLGF